MLASASKTLLRTQSDERLARLAASGSESAFAAIVERHTRLLTAACRRVLPDARVEDAVQQTFVSAWSALRRGVEVRDLRPWLLRIARNTALNALRVPGYDYEVLRESLQVTEAPPAELERMEVIRATLTGLADLPESQRDALLRSAVHGTPHAEIARGLGVSEGAVRQLVLRARIALRAAATAITPFPLAEWLAAPAGGGAILAKTGAVVVLAGSVAGSPALVDRIDRHGVPQQAQAAEAAPAAKAPARSDAGAPVSRERVIAQARAHADAHEHGRDRNRRNGHERDEETSRPRHRVRDDDEPARRGRKHTAVPDQDERDDPTHDSDDRSEPDLPDTGGATTHEPEPTRQPEAELAEAPEPLAEGPVRTEAHE